MRSAGLGDLHLALHWQANAGSVDPDHDGPEPGSQESCLAKRNRAGTGTFGRAFDTECSCGLDERSARVSWLHDRCPPTMDAG